MYSRKYVVVTIALVFLIAAHAEEQPDRVDFKKSLSKECEKSYTVTCLKLDIASFVDRLNDNEEYGVIPGVSVVRESKSVDKTSDIVSELARSFPDDPSARLDAFLFKKIVGYLNSHSIKLKLFEEKDVEEAITSARQTTKIRKRGGMLMTLLGAGAMMKGTLMSLAMAGIAAIAGKAILTGLIALMISAIVGLKSLTSGQGKTTYEVVSKPIYTQAHSHSVSHEEYGHGSSGGGHGGWGRSLDLPLPLGLQPGYQPA